MGSASGTSRRGRRPDPHAGRPAAQAPRLAARRGRRGARAARPARRGAAARADRRADAARRARGELLVPPPPGRLRVDRRALRRAATWSTWPAARATAPTCWPGGAARRDRRRRQPRGPRARAAQVRARPGVRFVRDLVETLRASRCDAVVFLQTIEHVERPRRGARRTSRSLLRPGGARLRLDAQRAHARAARAPSSSDNPWHVREYRAEEFRALCESRLRRASSCYGLFHARKLRVHELALRRRLGPRAPARSASPSRSTTASRPAISARDFALRGRRRSTARSTSSPSADGERAPAALALVLHTHMPYVEGFGTWPFGEEWLWEAVAGVLPAAARRARRRAPRDARADAGAVRPARGAARRGGRALPAPSCATSAPPIHDEDVAGLARGGEPELAAEVRARGGRLRARGAARSSAGRRSARARSRGLRAASSCGPRPRPTPCCRCWPPTPGCACSWRTGDRRRTARRFGDWGGGFWLPECAYAPGLERELAEHGRARLLRRPDRRARARRARRTSSRCATDGGPARRADRLADGRARLERPRRLPGRTAPTATTTAARSTTCGRGTTAAAPTTTRPRCALAREHARDFVEPARCAARAGGRRPASCCALDTELLGHWWYEGPAWLAAVLDEAAAPGPRRWSPSPTALERDEPAARPSWRRRPGARGKDLSTWDSPRGRRSSPSRARARRAAHRRGRGRPPGPRGRARARRARAAGAAVERLGVHGHARAGRRLPARARREATRPALRRRARRSDRLRAPCRSRLRNLAPDLDLRRAAPTP